MKSKIFIAIFFVLFLGCIAPFFLTSAVSPDLQSRAMVTHVIDGDTFDVLIGDRQERVRILGIDTPELKKGRKRSCYGQEAYVFARNILSGQEVLLIRDELSKEKDKYGRLLRTVKVQGRYDLSVLLLATGYAAVYEYEDFHKKSYYKKLERFAQKRGFGIWSDSCRE